MEEGGGEFKGKKREKDKLDHRVWIITILSCSPQGVQTKEGGDIGLFIIVPKVL